MSNWTPQWDFFSSHVEAFTDMCVNKQEFTVSEHIIQITEAYLRKYGDFQVKDWFIMDLFLLFLRSAQEFFAYMETSPLPVKGCEI
jgi:hypothetical protein